MIIDREFLKKYCSARWQCAQPFSEGDKSYATNGHVIIRVDRLKDVDEKQHAPKISSSSSLQKSFEVMSDEKFNSLDKIEFKKIGCSECAGYGKVNTCPDCSGEGVVFFQSQEKHDYQFPCIHCREKGCIGSAEGNETCLECHGYGDTVESKGRRINGTSFQNTYLYALSKLENFEISVRPDFQAAYFRFNGGDGLLMPRKE